MGGGCGQVFFAVSDLTQHSTFDPDGPQTVHELMRTLAKTYQVRDAHACVHARTARAS